MIPKDEVESLRQPIKWKLVVPVALAVVAMIAGYFYDAARRSRQLKEALLREHRMITDVLPVTPAYREMRARIARLAFSVIGPYQGDFRAEGFSMADLAREPVLYGRVRLPEIHRLEDVAPSIRHRYADQIGSCMGLETNAVSEFYRRGDFLMPSYVEAVRGVSDGDRLRVLREDLRFRVERDAAELLSWARRRYFVLSVDEAALSIDGPTRVYIWDLSNDRMVFRTRGSGEDTVIIPIRIAGMPGGGRPVPRPSNTLALTQHDCSVANLARRQLGVAVIEMGNVPDLHALEADGGSGMVPSDAASVIPASAQRGDLPSENAENTR